MSVSLSPGQSVSATVQGLDASNNVVPIVGPITFAADASSPLVVTQVDDQNASYFAPATAVAGDYAVQATFVNSLGATITVNDTVTVAAGTGVGVATSGQFVFGTPTP